MNIRTAPSRAAANHDRCQLTHPAGTSQMALTTLAVSLTIRQTVIVPMVRRESPRV